ncbi:hypothetical protein [Nocardia sp. NPDC024068]|uniref:hypothetical protein n=1 Tax=Nocardia sp. NPDC024068 TaxID=3157197 RepID=UPI0033E60F19
MDRTVRIGGDRYRVVGKAPLSAVSRACYGKFRFELRRVADGSAWTVFGTRVTPASELLRGD